MEGNQILCQTMDTVSIVLNDVGGIYLSYLKVQQNIDNFNFCVHCPATVTSPFFKSLSKKIKIDKSNELNVLGLKWIELSEIPSFRKIQNNDIS